MYGYNDYSSFIWIYLIVAIVVAIIFGAITKSINENKGYDGGFAWGFFLGWIGIIVVACRPSVKYTYEESIIVPANKTPVQKNTYAAQLLDDGTWNCSCGRHNARYVSSCVCGLNKQQLFSAKAETEESKNVMDDAKIIATLKEYKNLLDTGVITQEEFDAKKKDILSR